MRFTVNEDGSVTDSNTGLTWSRETLAKNVNHEQAREVLGDGWRLPTIQELFTLVDHNREGPAIDTDIFPDTEDDWYWTSTPTVWNETAVWVVDFDDGSVGYGHRLNLGCVRAVRSGQ